MTKEKKSRTGGSRSRREHDTTETPEYAGYAQGHDLANHDTGYREHIHQNDPLEGSMVAYEDAQYHDPCHSGSVPQIPADYVETIPRQHDEILLGIEHLGMNERVEVSSSQEPTIIEGNDEVDEPVYTYEIANDGDYAAIDDDVHFPYNTITEEFEGDPDELYNQNLQIALDQSKQPELYTVEDENGASSSRPSRPAPSRPAPSMSISHRHHSTQHKSAATGYVVERSSRFKVGAVFKTNWFEPRGAKRKTTDSYTDAGEDPYYHGIRRFIVTQSLRGHSVCVGIYTHGRQGCTKPGVHADYYGQAYDESYGYQPSLLVGEPKLGYPALAISIYPELINESIDLTSRINFAKPQSVEHNLPVQFIGTIAVQMMPVLNRCVNRARQSQQSSKGKGKGKGKGKDQK